MQQLLPQHFRIPYTLACKYARPGTNHYEELVSAGNYALVKALANFEEGKGAQLTSWLYGCVSLVLMREVNPNKHRHAGRWAKIASLDDPKAAGRRGQVTLAGLVAGREPGEDEVDVEEFVGKILDELEPFDRDVLVMRIFEGRPVKEIARRLGRSRSRGSQLYGAALGRAREIAKRLLGEE
jgi:RNA polymerase sigma factor (sigma-70 family)